MRKIVSLFTMFALIFVFAFLGVYKYRTQPKPIDIDNLMIKCFDEKNKVLVLQVKNDENVSYNYGWYMENMSEQSDSLVLEVYQIRSRKNSVNEQSVCIELPYSVDSVYYKDAEDQILIWHSSRN